MTASRLFLRPLSASRPAFFKKMDANSRKSKFSAHVARDSVCAFVGAFLCKNRALRPRGARARVGGISLASYLIQQAVWTPAGHSLRLSRRVVRKSDRRPAGKFFKAFEVGQLPRAKSQFNSRPFKDKRPRRGPARSLTSAHSHEARRRGAPAPKSAHKPKRRLG